ncbi:thioredoxin family protein [Dechloromonas sp. ARDL1]|uniref:thioredoxin family protein n=1 Tax=Dechloromonas sp. ARDL1 TaxID=3322121 RepID=UPI003DA710C9
MRRALLIIALTAVAALIWAKWPQSHPAAVATAAVSGPQVVLFKGDDSASCRAILRIVEEAEARYGERIGVTKVDWSPENPLIQAYQVRFLPTVVFVDSTGRERKRIVGESDAVQAELRQALAQAETLLRQ